LKTKLTDYFKKAIPSGEFISFIAEIDGKAVGCSGLIRWQHIPGFKENNENRGYIFNMYTVPDARGQGIASTLVALLIEEAKSLGIGNLSLHATPIGESIYRKAGFTDHKYKGLVLKF